ncbi:Nramp family divalent metal transporter [Galbibacter sp. EGI 63066]|uniref:Nramp family divalent metal transporter n=1 Tax=Galbibacter sp. EGI 63066 TaxID=2993559 RepID=UPI0022497E17|nr:Nramp family divalent metal transporter [Galbibacter sp. EGI 63066]MCX2678971.1 Nramp family divalent metal transporter [Galbibacter sp. EGI 63066]
MFKKIGPGVLVAAAFIGPGTVTACMLAGVSFGYALLWAMLLSVLATVVLQEMAARVGIVTQKGLADVLKTELSTPWIRYTAIAVILGAIVVGNAAYEGGNIGGATLGLQAIFGDDHNQFYPLVIGLLAFVFLFTGSYKFIEKTLVWLVIVMSLSFVVTAIVTKPDITKVLKGLFAPSVPEGSLLTIIALVGTTIVPYNLFLHASLVSEKWSSTKHLKDAKRDTVVSILLGGFVSMAIMVTAAQIPGSEITDVSGLAKGLEPVYGNSATYFIGIGLFAAGLTSAITAPLAAAYVAASCFGWNAGLKDNRFRAVWMLIIALGVFFMSFGIKPIEVIRLAQIANGILLPVIAIFLLWVVNKTTVMGNYKNTPLQNIIGILIVCMAVLLGLRAILKVVGWW